MRRSRLSLEGVERPDWVDDVESQVAREIHPGADRHADEGHVVLGGDGGHRCLGPVAPGHPEDVGAPLDRIPGQLQQVVPRSEHDRLDTPLLGFVDHVEAFDLAAPGFRVHDQDRVPGRGNDVTSRCDLLRAGCAPGEGVPGQDQGEDDEHDGGEEHESVELAPDKNDRRRTDQSRQGHDERNKASHAAAHEYLPRAGDGHRHAEQHEKDGADVDHDERAGGKSQHCREQSPHSRRPLGRCRSRRVHASHLHYGRRRLWPSVDGVRKRGARSPSGDHAPRGRRYSRSSGFATISPKRMNAYNAIITIDQIG